ncbi:MAG: sulfatase [Alphaproteobacteria bacterium]|nr:sulfatase [Alphaproteobacteria bacterium]
MSPDLARRATLPALLVAGSLSAFVVAGDGCSGGSDAPGTPPGVHGVAVPTSLDPRLPSTTGATALVLDAMPMQLVLPEVHGGDDGAIRTHFVLTGIGQDLQRESKLNGLFHVTAELPFRIPRGQRRFAPEGMVVKVNGKPVSFTAENPTEATTAGWRVAHERLDVVHPKEFDTVEIDHPGIVSSYARLDWAQAHAAGTAPEAFVRFGMSDGPTSREGLLLPAPSSATWSGITLPAGARFEAFLSLAPTPVTRASDGAEAVLELVDANGTTELGRLAIPGDTTSFLAWDLDLSAHAGTTGDLVLRTLPGATATDDYVFVGAPVVHGTPTGDVRRVIVIGVDTFRPDHLGMYGYDRDTSPALDAWARTAVVFDKAWTPAPRTRPSFRTATTGRLPLDAVCAENIGAVFDRAGYATAGIVANIHLNPRFGFDDGFDYWHLDGEMKANEQVDQAIAWLDDNRDRDSYLFLHVMDPHIFYVAPDPYGSRFEDTLDPLPQGQHLPPRFNRSMVYRWMKQNKLSPAQREHIAARYDGEIAFTTDELGRFLTHVDSLPGKTLVVLHSDHGEEFWEHDGFEHNHQVYEETVHGVLVIKPPGGTGVDGARSPVLTSLQDLGPTLFDLAGLTDTPPTDGVSLAPALRGQPMDDERAIPVGHLRYEQERWGVVWHGHKYILFPGTGKEELYDLAADPAEQHDLSATVDTTPYWQQLAASHHIDVGPGWRVSVDLKRDAVAVLQLPAIPLGADVLDPEAITHNPVNQVWGETPPVKPEDVATVTVDGSTVRIAAGRKGKGVVWIRFPSATAIEGTTVTVDGNDATLDGSTASRGGSKVVLKPGLVLVPPPGEAQRMKACEVGDDLLDGDDVEEDDASDGGEDAAPHAKGLSADKLAELCELGYLEGPQCEGVKPRGNEDDRD